MSDESIQCLHSLKLANNWEYSYQSATIPNHAANHRQTVEELAPTHRHVPDSHSQRPWIFSRNVSARSCTLPKVLIPFVALYDAVLSEFYRKKIEWKKIVSIYYSISVSYRKSKSKSISVFPPGSSLRIYRYIALLQDFQSKKNRRKVGSPHCHLTFQISLPACGGSHSTYVRLHLAFERLNISRGGCGVVGCSDEQEQRRRQSQHICSKFEE